MTHSRVSVSLRSNIPCLRRDGSRRTGAARGASSKWRRLEHQRLLSTNKENSMNQRIITTILLAASVALTGFSAGASAAGGSVTIESPKDGATVAANAGVKVEFKVEHTAEGNHLHFYVDNGDPTIVRKWSGSETLPPVSPGKHEICIKEATKGHVLTGLEKCVTVEAK
jgi:hypothetical protein